MNYEVEKPTPTVGYWRVSTGGESEFRLYTVKRPVWFHRAMVRLCFGIEWIDAL